MSDASLIQSILYGSVCLGCGNEGAREAGFCGLCSTTLMRPAGPCRQYFLRRKGGMICDRLAPADEVLALFFYGGAVAQAILSMKHRASYYHCAGLARILAAGFREARPEGPLLLVPMPSAVQHVLKRGFWHARVFADALAREWGAATLPALRSTRWSGGQQGLGARERRRQTRFALRRAAADRLQGRTLVLVDDVLASGASISEAAGILKEAGAGRVFGRVLAVSVNL